MAAKPLAEETFRKIKALLSDGTLSHREIAHRLGVSPGSVHNAKYRTAKPVEPEKAPVVPELQASIRKLLKKKAHTVEELADALDCGPAKVKAALVEMKSGGAMLLDTPDGRVDLADSIHLEPGKREVAGSKVGEWLRFGITSDNHLCNKHSRLDVLNEAYDHFEREGISRVFNAGNWIDGEARFNKTELVTRPGMDAQLDYMIDNWPVRKGIVTEYIAGDDHEGWYQQREGVEIGRYLQLRAEQQGRHDLHYLGYGECDVELKAATGSAVMRVVHPGGGSSYAISYTDQKRVESYQGGEKPQIEIAGHYHKYNMGFPREVYTLQPGCTCDQTMFMRKKRLQAHVGYCVVNIMQGEVGQITRFSVEWFAKFNRGFYENRF